MAGFQAARDFEGGKRMSRRNYLIVSVIIILIAGIAVAQSADKQKDKQKEKAITETRRIEEPEVLPEEPLGALTYVLGQGGYLGVYLEEVSGERVKELGLKEERGALIMKVVTGSPAEKAGLKENDVIVSMNGRRVDSVIELQRMLRETPPDRTVTFEVVRNGAPQTLTAMLVKRQELGLFRPQALEKLKESQDAMRRAEKEMTEKLKSAPEFGNFNLSIPGWTGYEGGRLGISVETLSDQLAEYFGVKEGGGLLVTEVRADKPAAKAGLKAGDVIVAADNKKVDSVQVLLELLSAKQEGTIELKVVRDRVEQTINVTLEKRERRNGVRWRPRMFASLASA
jgi:C-terminal processing protease CtpA/Prc